MNWLHQTMIDRKLEPLVKREMVKYLGKLEDDDLVMFVLDHLKNHKVHRSWWRVWNLCVFYTVLIAAAD